MKILRIITATLAIILATVPAVAQSPAVKSILLSVPKPSWVPPQSWLSCNFMVNQCWTKNEGMTSPAALWSLTRASVKYAPNSTGLYLSFASGIPAITDQGWSIEPTATNSALWSRDMTNATWVKSSVTTALNAVGIDGSSNSASTLTASGANGTILQTITLAANTDTYSVFLKRVTGSGAISITGNNFTATTTCPALSTTAWTVCEVSASLTNPVFGIKMATNGDVIVADFNQLAVGSYRTSPILTTSATATRAADIVTLNNPTTWVPFALNAIYYEWLIPEVGASAVVNGVIYSAIDTGANDGSWVAFEGDNPDARVVSGGGTLVWSPDISSNPSANVAYRTAMRVAQADFANAQTASIQASLATQASGNAPTGANPVAVTMGERADSTGAVALFARSWSVSPQYVANGTLTSWAQALGN